MHIGFQDHYGSLGAHAELGAVGGWTTWKIRGAFCKECRSYGGDLAFVQSSTRPCH